jgi:NADPH2:quinone reductase
MTLSMLSTLSDAERKYLSGQRHGRLATVAANGFPQVKPVGFTYNARLGTIDIVGYNMASSAKYKNVQANPKVAFTVDDAPGEGPAGVRFLEIRGLAETVTVAAGDSGSLPPEIIRIHPRRVLAYNIEPGRPGLQSRDIATMRAIQVTSFGGPEVLTPVTLPAPVPGPGEVAIAVSVADVLFLDAMIRSGSSAGAFPVRPPYVPGNGVAGHVVAVGAGVDSGLTGRLVVAPTGRRGGAGGYASVAVVPAERLVPVPHEVSGRVAGALLHDGATALGLLAGTHVNPGEWVLVLGAAGGLGLLLIQLARASGGQVIGAARLDGVARRQEKHDAITGTGATAVVDYGDSDWTRAVVEVTGGAGPDVVFDGVGGALGRAAFGVVAAGGRFSAHGAPAGGFTRIDPLEAADRRVKVRGIEQVQYGPARQAELTGQALAYAAAGRLAPVIGQVFPLERAAEAHAALADRSVVGKTLLIVD